VTKYRTIVADPPWRYKGTLPAPPHRYERGVRVLHAADLVQGTARAYRWGDVHHLHRARLVLSARDPQGNGAPTAQLVGVVSHSP
jgi:hypothetical protein